MVAVNEVGLRQSIEDIRAALAHDWSPEQAEVIHTNSREILVSGGERGGKSYTGAEYGNVRFPYVDLLWLVGKDYERCQSEFEYMAEAMKSIGAVVGENIHTPKNGQWDMTLTLPLSRDKDRRALVKTRSLQDWLKVGSEAPDGVIICEVAQIALQEYKRVCDRTSEKRGWVIGTGTFEGSLGWYPEMWKLYQLPGQDGISFSLPSWSNRHVFPGGYDDPEIQRLKAKHSEDYFNERFAAIPAPPQGLVFPEFRYLTHVSELELFDAPVELWIDPGYDGAYAVEAVQIVNDVIYVVDEIYGREVYTAEIIEACLQKPWWKLVKGGVIDIAATQHQGGVRPIAEEWLKSEAKLYLSSMKVEEAAGRDRLHTFMKVNPIDHVPRFIVNATCHGILSELGVCPNPFTEEAEPYKWKKNSIGQIVGQAPEDKNNHAIKAVIYGIVSKFGYAGKGGGKPLTSHSNRRNYGRSRLGKSSRGERGRTRRTLQTHGR